MGSTFQTVFWSLFGLAEKGGVLLEDYNKRFTELIGYLMYGAFNIASVIVLLNMLIAMMSKSYETIEEHADVEWKFARSKLYMEYVKEGNSEPFFFLSHSLVSFSIGGTLPVPFNIIPTPKDIYYFIRRIYSCLKRIQNPHERPAHSDELSSPFPLTIRMHTPNTKPGSPRRHGNIATISNGRMMHEYPPRSRQGSFEVNQQLTYRKVINRMIKRFLLHKQREEQGEIHEGDFEELKQDIQMLRYELLNRLEETREDLSKNSHLLNEGVMIVGELLSSCFQQPNSFLQENFQLFKKSYSSRTDSGMVSNTSTLSELSSTDPSGNYLRQLTVARVGLQQIVEDEEGRDNNNLPFIDDEIEEDIPARHISTQTSIGDFTRF